MRAAQLIELKQPLTINKVEDPVADDGQSIVTVYCAALNRRDYWIQQGQYPRIDLPVIPGSDGAGVIGDSAVIINPGLQWGASEKYQSDAFNILGMPSQGTFAEYVAVPSSHVYDKPEHLTFEEAAALPLAGVTAYRALFVQGEGKINQKVLITGVGGGVALTAMQFALAAEMKVSVTSGDEEKLALAMTMGAESVANYRNADWDKQLLSQSGHFDLIIDSAGGESFLPLPKLLKPGGRIVMYGGTLGKIPNLSPQLLYWRQISIVGSTMGSPKDFETMLAFVNLHKVKPVVDSVFPLEKINDAMDKLRDGTQFGKIVIDIRR